MIIQASSLIKDVYQPKDIAKMLGCSVRTVQNYCDESKIISYRNVKNRRLVDKDKLIDFLQSIDCYIDDIKTQRQSLKVDVGQKFRILAKPFENDIIRITNDTLLMFGYHKIERIAENGQTFY